MQPQGKCDVKRMVLFSAISRQAKASKLSLVFWLNEIVLCSAISRQAKASKLSLVFWLNEIVANVSISPFYPTCMLPLPAHFTPFAP